MIVGVWGMEAAKGGVTHRATKVLPPRSPAQGQTVRGTKLAVMKVKFETDAGPGNQLRVFKLWRRAGAWWGQVSNVPWEPSNNNGAG